MLTSPNHLQAAPDTLVRRTLVPWLCLLLAIVVATTALQLVAAAALVNTASTADSFAALDSTAALAPLWRADGTPQQPVQCDAMSKSVPADVLVAMTMEELRYLESTLCRTPDMPEQLILF